MREVLEIAQIIGFFAVVIPLAILVAIAGVIAYVFVWLAVLGQTGIYWMAGLDCSWAATYREVVDGLLDTPPGNRYV
jgi:hypothetical protein